MKPACELFEASEAVTPPLNEKDLKAVPAKRGVFALLAADGAPILVTTAADIRSRLRYRLTAPEPDERRKAADLREITAAVCWTRTYSRFETDWRYLETVRALWPESYGKLLPKRRAWFAAVDNAGGAPEFRVVSGVEAGRRQFGPFPARRDVERYIEALVDAFDLCRCVSILRQAPHGPACPYKQMGRCAAACDGSSSMEAYRALFERAVGYIAGDRVGRREELTERMRRASSSLEFEQAAAFKARLERLDELDRPRFRHVRDGERFRFVIIQSGPSWRQARSFLCDRGAIEAGPAVEFPPSEQALADVWNACEVLAAARGKPMGDADRRRMGLVAWYLFSERSGDGLLLRPDETPPDAARQAIIEAADELKLRPPARRAGRSEQERKDTGGDAESP